MEISFSITPYRHWDIDTCCKNPTTFCLAYFAPAYIMTASNGKKTYSNKSSTSQSAFSRYFEAFALVFLMPSAIVSFAVTVLDRNEPLDTTPMMGVLRLSKMPNIVLAIGYLVLCFVVLPIVVARMQ